MLSNKKHFITSSRSSAHRFITLNRYFPRNGPILLDPTVISMISPPERSFGEGARIHVRTRGVRPFEVEETREEIMALIEGDTAQ